MNRTMSIAVKLFTAFSCVVLMHACQPESTINTNQSNILNTNNIALKKSDYVQAIRSTTLILTGGYLPHDIAIDMNAFYASNNSDAAKYAYNNAIDVLMQSDEFEQTVREFFLSQLYANETMPFIARRPAELATQIFFQKYPMNTMFTTQNTVDENGSFIDYDQADHGGVQYTPMGSRAGIFTEVHIAKELNHSGSHFPAVRDYAKWMLCDLVSANFPKHKKWQSYQLAEPWKTGAGCPACHNFMQPVRAAFHRYGSNGEWRNFVDSSETWGTVPGQASEPHDQQGQTLNNAMSYYELFEGYGPVLEPKDLIDQTIDQYSQEVDECQTTRLLALVFSMVKETAGEQWVQPYRFDQDAFDQDFLQRAVSLYQSKQGVAYDFINELLKNDQLFVSLIINGVSYEE